jgi:beta-lactamase class A
LSHPAFAALATVVALVACGILLLALPPASARAAQPRDASGAAAAIPAFTGGDLPFLTVAQADVRVVPGAMATLPYRIEGAQGGAHVAITISPAAGGKVVKTITVAHPVASDRDLHVSFVCHLKAGPYVWTVHAVDRLLRSPTILGSAHLRVVSVYPSAAAIAKAIAWLKHRSGVTAVAVVDSDGVLHGWNQDRQFVTASVIKAMLLVEYLRTHASISSSALVTLTPMIEVSDNNAAEAIYHVVGDSRLYALAKAAGMKHFAIYGQLFGAQLTAADQARFFYRLPGLVPKSHRKLALYLLSHVVSYQSWGIPAAARPRGWQVWFKGGWRGTDIGQLVHQVARLHKGADTFSMAVFTDGDPSQGYGIETVEGVAARVLAGG